MVQSQLREQEEFILEIKLTLANLSKAYKEQNSELRNERL